MLDRSSFHPADASEVLAMWRWNYDPSDDGDDDTPPTSIASIRTADNTEFDFVQLEEGELCVVGSGQMGRDDQYLTTPRQPPAIPPSVQVAIKSTSILDLYKHITTAPIPAVLVAAYERNIMLSRPHRPLPEWLEFDTSLLPGQARSALKPDTFSSSTKSLSSPPPAHDITPVQYFEKNYCGQRPQCNRSWGFRYKAIKKTDTGWIAERNCSFGVTYAFVYRGKIRHRLRYWSPIHQHYKTLKCYTISDSDDCIDYIMWMRGPARARKDLKAIVTSAYGDGYCLSFQGMHTKKTIVPEVGTFWADPTMIA